MFEAVDLINRAINMVVVDMLGDPEHQLKEGLDFWLGGIKIPHTYGALCYSDANVLIHVICDALPGAAKYQRNAAASSPSLIS